MTRFNKIYNAQIVAGSLLVPESRKIADLMLSEADDKAWYSAIIIDNVLQKRSPSTAKREAKLIKNRLQLMKRELWEYIRDGNSDVATQSVLACAIKHNRLLGDFMDKIIRQHWQFYDYNLSNKDWSDFWDMCSQIDEGILKWSGKTFFISQQISRYRE